MNTKLFKNKFMAIVAMFTIVLGVGAAVAMKAPEKKQFTNYWFDTTAAGVPTTYDSSGPQCSETTGDYCSKEYSASQINFVGGQPSSVKSGQENLQIASAQKGD
ncbi:hypothetical protein [Mucilaginibacter lappiensis]|uniref:Uncharacterized protein n=1 Tax=Mucilaginibacter lappiensis TaxID=354630 RepID=A0A841JKZ1_9SPHI|nr:hypothetical protein [Mucilaginibacter lappiensis]MBB6128611.1 hypothetical protein [Mucilaginibacter lappiensis]MDP9077101.1 hypothetical protein [Bacteroidota bacterium]